MERLFSLYDLQTSLCSWSHQHQASFQIRKSVPFTTTYQPIIDRGVIGSLVGPLKNGVVASYFNFKPTDSISAKKLKLLYTSHPWLLQYCFSFMPRVVDLPCSFSIMSFSCFFEVAHTAMTYRIDSEKQVFGTPRVPFLSGLFWLVKSCQHEVGTAPLPHPPPPPPPHNFIPKLMLLSMEILFGQIHQCILRHATTEFIQLFLDPSLPHLY